MIKLIVAGRTYWMVAGVVYTTLSAALQARDGAR